MSTIADFHLHGDALALSATFERADGAICEMEEALATDFPSLWIGGESRQSIEDALTADPSVTSFTVVTGNSNEWLFELTLTEGAIDPFARTRIERATIVEASAANGTWSLRVRFPDRGAVSRTYDRFTDDGVTVDVTRLQDVSMDAAENLGLTDEQYEALVAAIEHGYFQIPRRTSLQDLAAELGISHQALSERLRRAFATLVEQELDLSAVPEARADPAPVGGL